MSYDIINLYPSVPINKALDVLIDQLNNDKDDLMKRTKLCLKDIYEPAQLCLRKCYFLWKNEIRILKNLGPIGLSFMNVLSEFGTQNHCRSIDLKAGPQKRADDMLMILMRDSHLKNNLANFKTF